MGVDNERTVFYLGGTDYAEPLNLINEMIELQRLDCCNPNTEPHLRIFLGEAFSGLLMENTQLKFNGNGEITVEYSVKVPAMKNKKRRIQKKWIKRYGYKDIKHTIKGAKIRKLANGKYEVVGNIFDNPDS